MLKLVTISILMIFAYSPMAHALYPETTIVSGECKVQAENQVVHLRVMENYQNSFGVFAAGKTTRGTEIRILLNYVFGKKKILLEIGNAHGFFPLINGEADLELTSIDGKGGGWLSCNLHVKVEPRRQ